jgi:trypsin
MSRTRFRRSQLCAGMIALALYASAAVAQEARPHTWTLSDERAGRIDLLRAMETAKQATLIDLRKLGGQAALRAEALSTLPPFKVIERLSVDPEVGPSTIAAPPAGASVPVPSVNWVGSRGGATSGHPGVALLLARLEGNDAFNVHCTGTLIRQNLVLTAAHCVCYSPVPSQNHSTGETCMKGAGLTAPSALTDARRWRVFFQHTGIREVQKVEVDQRYRFEDGAVRNDLALLVLSAPVSEIVPPVLAGASDQTPAWQQGTVVGFGFSANPSEVTSSFLTLILPGIKAQGMLNSASCSDQAYLDPLSALCSKFQLDANQAAATVCEGDSGGPLWEGTGPETDIGVTSGRNNKNCAALGTLAFQMSIAHRAHWDWINERVVALGSPNKKGRWPVFGENLRYVIDRRNIQSFDASGNYASEGWMTTSGDEQLVLGTVNSSARISRFALEDRSGRTLCEGASGAAEQLPTVRLCSAAIAPDVQFRVVASGERNELLQYVVTTHATGPN